MAYSVIIRAHEATPLIFRAVQCLRAQSKPPLEIVIVDSSNTPETQAGLRVLADVHVLYGEGEFNYSRAIHLGVAAAQGDHVLIHSSHVALLGAQLIEQTFQQAHAMQCEVFYCRKGSAVAHDKIDESTFDGRNGLANSCAMIPRHLLLQRRFREDVFSAEDQEWAAWFIREYKGSVLRLTSPLCSYENPHLNIQKKVNEDLAVACFVNRHERWPHNIAARLVRAALAFVRRRPDRARMHWLVATGLLATYFSSPQRKSKYF
ncbi:MAG: glycosyltransferase [Gammaproteobacteria bacterium]|nr:glycosyltransferase [Gammaproteobacteria bacterium]MBU0850424.1 glycosyltransferase [Gammaproteobacteria bacterium]MBU1267694.1 glycosyltransferase [Gammaproteobacteria bacterium]MBU1528510.1 glycosyltransferase [Gammaproteobacteria bacterium]MBU1781093.1 glycosyltransferase [Gammaproteobacteria bacterium]